MKRIPGFSVVAAAALLAACIPAPARKLGAADAAFHEGRYEAAQRLYAEAAARAPEPAERARARSSQAALALLQGRAADAERLYRQAAEDLRAAPPQERAAAVAAQAAAVAAQGRSEDAVALYHQATADYERAPDAAPLDEAARLGELAQLELARRRYPEAQKALERAVALREKAGGRFDPELPLLRVDLEAAKQAAAAGGRK